MNLENYHTRILLSPLTSRSLAFVGALLVMALGIRLASEPNLLIQFAGAFLAISGGQVALWVLGVRLEILSNTLGPTTSDVDDNAGDEPHGYYWQEPLDVEREATGVTTEVRLELLAYEMRGRILSAMGYLLGEASMEPGNPFKARDEEKLSEAIDLCQRGHELLIKVEGTGELMALNNLIFYSCVLNDITRRQFLLEKARLLLRAGQERNAADLVLTACRALLQFGTNEEERREALAIICALTESSRLSDRQRKEALIYIDHFSKSRPPMAPNPGPQADV